MRDLSYGWNNGRMMLSALQALNDESLRLMEIISHDDKLPDWTLAKVSTALDRLTMARQHIESLMKMGYQSNPGFMDKVKSALGMAKDAGAKAAKATVKATKKAGRFTADRVTDIRQSGVIASLESKIDNLEACAKALDMPEDQMMQTARYKELVMELELAKSNRLGTIESRKTRAPIRNRRNPDHTRKAGILRPRGEGFNEARKALRIEYREKYGDDWHEDVSLKDEMYDRLRDMGY